MFPQVLEETGFEMRFYADPETYFEHNFQDHQVQSHMKSFFRCYCSNCDCMQDEASQCMQ